MSQERLPMVKIREVLRLQAEGLKQREIAASVNCARSTVQECLQRARTAGIGWPIPEDLDELTLADSAISVEGQGGSGDAAGAGF